MRVMAQVAQRAELERLNRWAVQVVAIIGAAVVALVVAVVVLVVSRVNGNGDPPNLYQSAPDILIARQMGDQWVSTMSDGFVVADLAVGLPIATAVCSAVDGAIFQPTRQWVAFNDGERVFDFTQTPPVFESSVSAGECSSVGVIINPLPPEVISEALDRPGLTWQLIASTRAVDPEGMPHLSTSEVWRFASLGDAKVVDRTADMAQLLADHESTVQLDDPN